MVFLALAWATPPYTDQLAHDAAAYAIDHTDNFDGATAAYMAAERRYATNKWLYADLAYGFLAWAALIGSVGAALKAAGQRALCSISRLWPLLGVSLLGIASLGISVLAMFFQRFYRMFFPPWRDSPLPALVYALAAMLLLGPVVLALALGPRAFRPRNSTSVHLFQLSGASAFRTWLANAIYFPPLLLCATAILVPFTPGGWSYALTAGLLGWLFLNGRAMALGPNMQSAPAVSGQ